MAVIYTIHLHTISQNIWSKIHLPKSLSLFKNQWPNKGDQHCYLSISKQTACSVRKCVLWDQILAIHQDVFYAELHTVVEGIKVSRMSYCRYVLLYQWRWKFKLNSTWSSNPGFQKINEKPMWFMDTMLKLVRKYQDGIHNSHWNLVCLGGQDKYISFTTASLWHKAKQVWRSG